MTVASSSRSRPTSDPPPEGDRLAERREFLKKLSGLVGTGLTASLSPGCTAPPRSFRAPPGPTVEVPLRGYPELLEPGGTVKVLTQAYGPILVRRLDDDGLLAVSGLCPHQGCVVNAKRDGFFCPCHGASFDRQGRNPTRPARQPLRRFSVSEEAEKVVLELPAIRARRSAD